LGTIIAISYVGRAIKWPAKRIENKEYKEMKKSLLFALILGTLAVAVPAAEAKTVASPALGDPQIRIRIGGNRNRNRFRRMWVTTTTRVVGFGRNRYRETVRVTHYPNGRTTTQVISRERVRW
jgi:hypothetical protein